MNATEEIKLPTLSIIVPVYKVERYVAACIDSILAQTFTDWELILVDDGSPDKSGEICDEYSNRDTRIRVIHKNNEGVCAARNKGIDSAKGQYLMFIDSDDKLGTPFTIENNINILLQDPSIDIVQFPFEYDNGKVVNQISDPILYTGKLDKLINLRSVINTGLCAKIYKSVLFDELRLPLGMEITEDEWLMIDLLLKTEKVFISTKGSYIYFMREDSATHSMTPSKWLDVFYTDLKFYKTLKCIGSNVEFLNKQFLKCCRSFLTVQIAYKNQLQYSGDAVYLMQNAPPLSIIYNKKISLKDRLVVLGVKLLGLRVFTSVYVNFVLLRKKL